MDATPTSVRVVGFNSGRPPRDHRSPGRGGPGSANQDRPTQTYKQRNRDERCGLGMSTTARHIGNMFRHIERRGDCWHWTGRVIQRRPAHTGGRLAHRLMYQYLVGPIPEGMQLDHLCENGLCVFPDHLEPVTALENVRRYRRRAKECKKGHPFTPETQYVKPNGNRLCRICASAANARRYADQKENAS